MGHYPRLFDQVRSATREHRLSYRAEQAYVMWVQQFIHFHDCAHPQDLGPLDVEAFLSHLALDRNVAPSTQSQALSAIVFLYTYVQLSPLGNLDDLTKVKATSTTNKQRNPVTFSADDATTVLSLLKNPYRLIASLMYSSGLRLVEALRLRVKDIDFHKGTITIRDGKCGKDRVVPLSDSALLPLKKQIGLARCIHDEDLADGYGRTVLPNSLARKYGLASSEFGWQLVFPSGSRSLEARSGVVSRYHLPEQSVQRAVRSAIIEVCNQSDYRGNIDKQASCHTFRHTFAIQSLQRGVDIHTVKEQLGHSDISAMHAYTHSTPNNDTHPLKTA